MRHSSDGTAIDIVALGILRQAGGIVLVNQRVVPDGPGYWVLPGGLVEAGELITIRALISHVMENGLRRDSSGEIIPRRIINRFTCDFNGETVFACDLDSAIAANPYFEFTAKVPESGTFQFEYKDHEGDAVRVVVSGTVQAEFIFARVTKGPPASGQTPSS